MESRTSRRFTITINNWTAEDEEDLQRIHEGGNVRFVIYKPEIGEQGTPHLQVYLELNSPRRTRWVSRYLPRAHILASRGSRQDNLAYVRKPDTAAGAVRVIGSLVEEDEPGARNDMLAACKEAQTLGTVDGIIEEHPNLYCRYHAGFDKLAFLGLKERARKWRKLTVKLYWGATGTGKTRLCFQDHPALYKYDASSGHEWWDGYNGESVVLFDDYDGAFPLHRFKTLLDGYPVRLPVKGSHTWALWTTVLITSNEPMSKWYPWASDEHQDAIKRRIHEVYQFPLNAVEKLYLGVKF